MSTLANAGKIVGCSAQFLASSTVSLFKRERLSYGSYCDEMPPLKVALAADFDEIAVLQ